MSALRAASIAAVTNDCSDTIVAPLFVLWAAQEFRDAFDPENRDNAHFTWDFLFRERMRLSQEWLATRNAEATGRRLAETGLRALGRPVQIDTAGNRQFLRSIVAEGGIPQSLLRQNTAYRRTVLAALEELEAMRVFDHDTALVAVARRDGGLSQVFRSDDIRHLLADLVLKLAELRAAVPERARAAPETWLDATRPGWRDELPMRLDEGVARLLISDALAVQRRRDTDDKLVTRVLIRTPDGPWQSRLHLGQRTILPLERLLPIAGPDATSARLSPDHPLAMHLRGAALRAELGHDERTWTVSLVGPGAGIPFPFPLDAPATFSVLVNGRNCGRLVPAGGEGAEGQEVSFWIPESLPAAESAPAPSSPPARPDGPLRRIGTGSIRTRSPVVTMLAPAGTRVSVSGLDLAGPEPSDSGAVYHLQGHGDVIVDGETLCIRTGADSESAYTLAATGATVPRMTDGAGNPVYLGLPAFSVHSPQGLSRRVSRQLSWREGQSPPRPLDAARRPFGTGTLTWRDTAEIAARGRFSIVPKGFVSRVLLADRATRLVVELGGLPPATVVSLSFAADVPGPAGVATSDGAARIEVELGARVPPEQLLVCLTSPDGSLTLRTPFLSDRASFVGPDGMRLVQTVHIGVEGLDNLRALVPEQGVSDLALAAGSVNVEFRLDGPTPLATFRGVVQALLLVSPDHSVTATIYTNGLQSSLIIIHQAHRLSLDRLVRRFGDDPETDAPTDTPPPPPSAAILADQLGQLVPAAQQGFLAAERFPIDWALLPILAWSSGIATAAERVEQILTSTGLVAEAAASISDAEIVEVLAGLIEVRPELWMHAVGGMSLHCPRLIQALLARIPAALIQSEPLEALARTMISHFPGDFPLVFGDVRARIAQPKLQVFHTAAQPILEAPFVAAEIALGLRPAPDARTVAALATFRHYDPRYFERALPVAMKMLGQGKPTS